MCFVYYSEELNCGMPLEALMNIKSNHYEGHLKVFDNFIIIMSRYYSIGFICITSSSLQLPCEVGTILPFLNEAVS